MHDWLKDKYKILKELLMWNQKKAEERHIIFLVAHYLTCSKNKPTA